MSPVFRVRVEIVQEYEMQVRRFLTQPKRKSSIGLNPGKNISTDDANRFTSTEWTNDVIEGLRRKTKGEGGVKGIVKETCH